MKSNLYQPYLFLLIVFSALLAFSCSTESTPVYQLSVDNEIILGGSISTSGMEAEQGDSITVTAVPDEHFKFVSWGGDYSGTDNPMTIIMDSDKILTAIFEKVDYPITVHIQGEGSVKEEIIQNKTTDYTHGSWIKLTAEPEYGWEFTEWQGGANGSDHEIEVEVDGPIEITAVFERVDFELTVHTQGEGNVSQEVVQAKTTDYAFETLVQLTAQPANGWKFSEWSGDASGSDATITVELDKNKEITATFERLDFLVTININGEGEVTQEIIQSKTISDEYPFETQVRLTSIPNSGWKFSNWSGDASGSDATIVVEVDKNKEITATFITEPTVSTSDVSNTTQTSARSGGNVTNDGGATVSERGLCWSSQESPDQNNGTCRSSGSGLGTFTLNMSGLDPGTTYYVRAYAENSAGKGWGSPKSFTTMHPLTVITSGISSITTISAVSGGNITHDGGATVTQRGVCWSNFPKPTLEYNLQCSQQGSGTGSFTTELTGLVALNNYWVRSYAINSQGTTYGNQVSFTTLRSDDSGSDDGGGGSDDGGGGSDDGGSTTPPPSSPPPSSPGNVEVLVMFLESGFAFGTPVDVKLNDTWYQFSGRSINDARWDSRLGNARGQVITLDRTVRRIELNPNQIRFDGLNNHGFGFTSIKIMQKHPDANLRALDSEVGSINNWAYSYDDKGILVLRNGFNAVFAPDPYFYIQDLPNSWTSSGKLVIVIGGVGQHHPSYPADWHP